MLSELKRAIAGACYWRYRPIAKAISWVSKVSYAANVKVPYQTRATEGTENWHWRKQQVNFTSIGGKGPGRTGTGSSSLRDLHT